MVKGRGYALPDPRFGGPPLSYQADKIGIEGELLAEN